MKFAKFFSNIQEAPWYRDFLNPVINEINKNSNLLDIGTGTGKMLQILSKEKDVRCVGTDTNSDMLDEAKEKLKSTDIQLHLIKAGEVLPFEKGSFDFITICSVLFHLTKEEIDDMLNDSFLLLKPKGKIIIHTPTGKGGFMKLTRHYFSFKNVTMYLWYRLTKNRSMRWTKEKYISEYAKKHDLFYTQQLGMNEFAQIEIIQKN